MLLLVALVFFAAVFVIWGTVARNSWGINFKRVVCPRCIHRISRGTGPMAFYRMCAGRSVCPNCQTWVNKWGRELMPSEKDRRRAQRHLKRH